MLPHEAWHVGAAGEGRVKRRCRQRECDHADAGLEHEADVMGAQAGRCASDPPRWGKRNAGRSKAGRRNVRSMIVHGETLEASVKKGV